MAQYPTLVWLLLIIFMFHDFEEIVFMRSWFIRNHQLIKARFPKIVSEFTVHIMNTSTQAFALAVAEEFIILSAVTVLSVTLNFYYIWFGAFIAFSLHLIIHILQALVVRKYIPCLITSVAALPYCVFTYIKAIGCGLAFQSNAIISAFIFTVIMIANVLFLHKLMPRFDQWRESFEKNR